MAARRRWNARHVLVVDLGDRIVLRPVADDPVAELAGKYRDDHLVRVAGAEEAAVALDLAQLDLLACIPVSAPLGLGSGSISMPMASPPLGSVLSENALNAPSARRKAV